MRQSMTILLTTIILCFNMVYMRNFLLELKGLVLPSLCLNFNYEYVESCVSINFIVNTCPPPTNHNQPLQEEFRSKLNISLTHA